MGKVIRITDETFRRLQALAEPFVDTPGDVIKRLLDEHDLRETKGPQFSVQENRKEFKEEGTDKMKAFVINRGQSISAKQMGMISRKRLAKHLEATWGHLNLKGICLSTVDEKKKIICLYSSGSSEKDGKWFFGINPKHWQKWDPNFYLALILRDSGDLRYIIFSPEESQELLNKCGQDNQGNKKINIRTPSSGPLYIQEWPEFSLEKKLGKIS